MRLLLSTVPLLLISSLLHGQLYFADAAAGVGLDYTKQTNTIGNGVSFCDFDGDGFDDITLATEAGKPIEFYRNNGGQFEKLSSLVDHTEEAKQVLWVDFDNDGDKDLYVCTFNGINRLYKQTGTLIFEDITERCGLPLEEQFSYGACWGDVDRDGWLDLYYSNRKASIYDSNNQNRLFKNNADGSFREITWEANVADQGKIPFCSAFFDVNNDQWPDIYTANDKLTENTLLVNNGDGTFSDLSIATAANKRMNAMCVAVGDYDNDGWQDVYVSNTPIGNGLFHNLGIFDATGSWPLGFEEIAGPSGVGFYGNGWGSNFLDADNDGDLDLYASGSYPGTEQVSSRFFTNEGNGQFIIPDAGFQGDTTSSYCNAIGDFDQNGFPDILVQNNYPFAVQLWQNSGDTLNWLKIGLEGTLSNRDAIGARIDIYTAGHYQMRYRHCGIGFLGQNSETEIIGLGTADQADSVIVRWPTGHIDRLFNVEANSTLYVLEGSTTDGIISVSPDVQLTTEVSANYSPDIDRQIRLSPNPAHHFLEISVLENGPTEYSIVDMLGRVYAQKKITRSSWRVNIDAFPSQQYLIRFIDRRGRVWSKKWMKL